MEILYIFKLFQQTLMFHLGWGGGRDVGWGWGVGLGGGVGEWAMLQLPSAILEQFKKQGLAIAYILKLFHKS